MRGYTRPPRLSQTQKNKSLQITYKRWKPNTPQRKIIHAIYNEGYKRVFVRAGRKLGKNELGNLLSTKTSIVKDYGESYLVGPTKEQEKKIVWNNNRLQRFPPDFVFKGRRIEIDNKDLIVRFPWGSFIQVDGSLNVEAGRGREFDFCLLDEFKDQNYEYYEAAYPNLLAKNGILVVIGTPPFKDDPDRQHFFELEEEAKKSKLWKYFRFKSWDNDSPALAGWLRQWLIEEKEAYYRRGDEQLWRIEYEAEDVEGGKDKIFPSFQDIHHVRELDVLLAELARGIKYGTVDFYTFSDPGTSVFCTLFIAYNRATSQIYVLDEIYETDRLKTSAVPMWQEIINKKHEILPAVNPELWTDIYDEAASYFQVEISTHFGDTVIATEKAAGKGKLAHVSLLKDAMSVPRQFNVSSRCVQTINEIKCFRDINSDLKNHALDNLRYFIEKCGYEFQLTSSRIAIPKNKLTELPRGYRVEDDLAQDIISDDPFSRLMDFGSFDTTSYGDIFGF